MAIEKHNPVREKSYSLAVEIVKICKQLQENKEFVVSNQLLKSGTSIGANIEEALQGQSRADFIAKLSISHKEAYETRFWLRLIHDSGLLKSHQLSRASELLRQVIALLTAIIKTSKLTK